MSYRRAPLMLGLIVLTHCQSNPSTEALPVTSSAAPWSNSLGMKFVPVPGTRVLFCIHETRNQDYATFASKVPGVNPQWQHVHDFCVSVSPTDKHPVVMVSRENALAFCKWLSQQENRHYRLPTAAEWDQAVGLNPNDPTDQFPWGKGFPPPRVVGNYATSDQADSILYKFLRNYQDGYEGAAPVMSYPSNGTGLYDMGGNVFEWIIDTNRKGSGALRGGSWLTSAAEGMLSREPVASKTDAVRADFGFRIVLER